MNRLRLMTCLAVGLLAVAGCKKAVPEIDLAAQQPRVTMLPEAHDPGEVRAAIIKAVQSHGWSSEGENGASVLGRLNHKGTFIRVNVDYDANQFVIRAVEATGNEKNFDRYIATLEREIRDGIKKGPPAPVFVPPAPTQVGPPPTLVVFEREQAPGAVTPAIQRALASHSWVLESQDASGLVGRLNHRKGMVRVRIVADTHQASIAYLDSQELSFDTTGRNDEYEKWMRNLADAIRANTR